VRFSKSSREQLQIPPCDYAKDVGILESLGMNVDQGALSSSPIRKPSAKFTLEDSLPHVYSTYTYTSTISYRKKPPCDAQKALRRDLATNLATKPSDKPCDETLRRGDVCGKSIATDVATETLRHRTMSQMAEILLLVMFHSM